MATATALAHPNIAFIKRTLRNSHHDNSQVDIECSMTEPLFAIVVQAGGQSHRMGQVQAPLMAAVACAIHHREAIFPPGSHPR
jgi:hypothetical protein